jgi:hypothetical protein
LSALTVDIHDVSVSSPKAAIRRGLQEGAMVAGAASAIAATQEGKKGRKERIEALGEEMAEALSITQTCAPMELQGRMAKTKKKEKYVIRQKAASILRSASFTERIVGFKGEVASPAVHLKAGGGP